MSILLEEIANLLLILHDKYLHGAEGSTFILHQLMRLLHDLGLTENISLLDVERIRIQVMIHKESKEKSMSYESFYEWLREIACLMFKKYDENGSRALNLLLTRHIIPFATNEKEGTLAVVSFTEGHVSIDNTSLRVLLPYGDFLTLWFSSDSFNEKLRLTPNCLLPLRSAYQSQPLQLSNTISADKIFDSLKSCDIFSDNILENDVRFFAEMVKIASVPRDKSGKDNTLNYLAFPGFLCVLENIAKRVSLSEVQSLGMGFTTATKLIVLLQTLSGKLLSDTLERFVSHENEMKDRVSGVDSSPRSIGHINSMAMSRSRTSLPSNISHSLSLHSVLWLARQAGITQIAGLSLSTLLDELISKSDTCQLKGLERDRGHSHTNMNNNINTHTITHINTTANANINRNHAWSTTHLPHTLCQIVETYSRESSCRRLISSVSTLTGISSIGRVALLLAQYIPSVFFASPVCIPHILAPLYTEHCIRQLGSISHEVDMFFKMLTSPSTSNKNDSQQPSSSSSSSTGNGNGNGTIKNNLDLSSYSDFHKLCLASEFIPYLLPEVVVAETFEYVLGYSLSDSEGGVDVQVCRNDWIEVLFVLAQICFKDNNDVDFNKTNNNYGNINRNTNSNDDRSVGDVEGGHIRKLSQFFRFFNKKHNGSLNEVFYLYLMYCHSFCHLFFDCFKVLYDTISVLFCITFLLLIISKRLLISSIAINSFFFHYLSTCLYYLFP